MIDQTPVKISITNSFKNNGENEIFEDLNCLNIHNSVVN